MSEACLCPETYPDWHQQDIDLSGHAVHRLPMAAFMFMPLSYDSYVQRQADEITQLELVESWPGLALSRTRFWGGEILRLLESSDSASRRVTHLESPFLLHGYLHHGDMGTIRESAPHLQSALFEKGRIPKELYLCYLTCDICQERKGGHKILLLRRWQESPRLAKRLKKQQMN